MNRAVLAAVSFGSLVLVLSSMSAATDAGSGVALDWVAPEGCESRDDVERRILKLLEGSTKPARELTIRARVGRGGGVWTVTLETKQDERLGQRAIRAESCEALAGAVALVVAMSIDPEAVLQNQAQTSDAGDAAEASPTPTTSARLPPPRPATTSRPGVKARTLVVEAKRVAERPFTLGLALALDAGRLPNVAPGERISLAQETGRFRIGFGFAEHWPQSVEVANHPGAEGRFGLSAGQARGCYRVTEWLFGCLGADVSRIRASSSGVRAPASTNAWLFSPTLGGELGWPLSDEIGLTFGADLAVSLNRRPFEIDRIVVHEPSRFTLGAAIGGEVHF